MRGMTNVVVVSGVVFWVERLVDVLLCLGILVPENEAPGLPCAVSGQLFEKFVRALKRVW